MAGVLCGTGGGSVKARNESKPSSAPNPDLLPKPPSSPNPPSCMTGTSPQAKNTKNYLHYDFYTYLNLSLYELPEEEEFSTADMSVNDSKGLGDFLTESNPGSARLLNLASNESKSGASD